MSHEMLRVVVFFLHQQKDSSLEESESSGDEKQEVTSNFKEESEVTSDLYQSSQKPLRHVTISKRSVKESNWGFSSPPCSSLSV